MGKATDEVAFLYGLICRKELKRMRSAFSKTIKSAVCLLLAAAMLFACACSSGKGSGSASVIKVATGALTGNFNPFYASEEGDKAVSRQVYPSIQRLGPGNKLINDLGSVSYELGEGGKVKYTVTIKDDLRFSDGAYATIDDVIFWYYFLADASYDGPYKDFYLNDIEGIKEYYFDDANYAAVISTFDGSASKLSSYIKKNYSDGVNVDKISGIKRIDDYTCTVTFNSRNINSVSALNAPIVSKAFYSADYVKGGAAKVKEITGSTMGCGAYYISDYSEKEHKAVLSVNQYSAFQPSVFKKAEFIDVAAAGIEPEKAISEGKADIVSVTASPQSVSALSDSGVKLVYESKPVYESLFISASLPSDARKAIMSLCSSRDEVDKLYAGYYTKLVRPLSVRFKEYPTGLEAYYQSTLKSALLSTMVSQLTAYCKGGEDSLQYALLTAFARNIQQYNVNINIKACGEKEFYDAVKSGKADMWIDEVYDGATCDKYDYYNSNGSMNYTGLSDSRVDEASANIRAAVGFADRGELMKDFLELIMDCAVELPLYQNQTVTAYNTEVINEKSLIDAAEYDGYADLLARLY